MGRAASFLTGSRLTRGVLARLGLGGAGFGIILSAVVLMPLRMALLWAMFSRRLRSNSLMTVSFLRGGILGLEEDDLAKPMKVNKKRVCKKKKRDGHQAL